MNKSQKEKSKKIRTFEIVSNLDYIDEETIKKALYGHTSIKKWAYILHDKDKYTKEDYEKHLKEYNNQTPNWKVGDKKPNHFHIVGRIDNTEEINVIAKWFDIATNMVEEKVSKQGWKVAFLDILRYITHEEQKQQDKGKYNFRQEIEDFKKYGTVMSARELMLFQVLNEGKTINECKSENLVLYSKIWDKVAKNRREYLNQNQKPPTTRINYYISGVGGLGKGLMSKAIARQLFPHIKIENDIYYEVGRDKKVTFDGYDGQPVIIWNDLRAYELLEQLGGRGNVFDIFDTHPGPVPKRQNIKYGSITLCNAVNIVNSVEDYSTFLDGLAGEYKDKNGELRLAEDKNQSYRRFPMIMPLHKADFDLLINKGFMYDTDDFQEYEEFKYIRGNMQEITIACQNNEKMARIIEKQVLSLPTREYNKLKDKEAITLSDKEIMEMFKDYGTQDLSKLEGDPFADFNESTKLESEELNEVKKSEDESDVFDDIPDIE